MPWKLEQLNISGSGGGTHRHREEKTLIVLVLCDVRAEQGVL